MTASLIESPDEHHLVLLDTRLTQLAVDARELRLQTWSLDASLDIRIAAPFTLRTGEGAPRTLDPQAPETLAPALALLQRPVRSLTMTVGGELVVVVGDGELRVRPHGLRGAWEVQGAGALEGLLYRSAPGGGAPWE
jgi:hypothetical protein